MPAATPIGVPIAIAIRLMITLPKNALSRPPASPGGGVISVNRAMLSELMPLLRVVHRIQTSQNRPNIAASTDSTCTTTFLTRLRA